MDHTAKKDGDNGDGDGDKAKDESKTENGNGNEDGNGESVDWSTVQKQVDKTARILKEASFKLLH